MNITRVLRPAQKILTTTIVATLATTCLFSAGSSSLAKKEGPGKAPSSSAMKEWRVSPGDKTLAMKEWRSKGSAPLVNVAQSASPALGTSDYEHRTLRQINRVRHNHHLRRLTFQSCANRVANRWSAHLASTNTFYHQSMTRLLKRCNAHYAGETLGIGSVTPRKLVSMWMHSAPHRHILLSKAPRRIGIGATPNSNGQWVTAANFFRF
jgi:uncharacterized protein YkwD